MNYDQQEVENIKTEFSITYSDLDISDINSKDQIIPTVQSAILKREVPLHRKDLWPVIVENKLQINGEVYLKLL